LKLTLAFHRQAWDLVVGHLIVVPGISATGSRWFSVSGQLSDLLAGDTSLISPDSDFTAGVGFDVNALDLTRLKPEIDPTVSDLQINPSVQRSRSRSVRP
jgi:hypothetical protein